MPNIIYERRGRLSSRLGVVGGGGGVGAVVLFYVNYIGMCHTKGYGFFPVLVCDACHPSVFDGDQCCQCHQYDCLLNLTTYQT